MAKKPMPSLGLRATLGLMFLLAVIGGILFGAGGWAWQGWIYLAVFGGASALITIDLARRDPALLERRVQAGPLAEPTLAQKLIQAVAGLAFLAIFVVSARTRIECVAMTVTGDAMVALGFWIVARVFRANTFTSATVGVEAEQRVIDTGPYAIVRHPMYSGALVLLIGTPLALGSWWGLTVIPVMIGILVARLLDEERLLRRDLPGYVSYCERVRWRLVPGVF
ncbi:MAG: isoprenylcysteine carboxylmethyltransferase family protein [Kofleriaceae bacterium]